MSVLAVSDHAVERFIKRWRRDLSFPEARAALEELVTRAAATRRKTLPGDARIYTVLTEEGVHIPMAVRDNVVVTVLDASSYETPDAAIIEALDEEEERKALQLANERSRAQRLAAERTIAQWMAGGSFSSKALQRARDVLGLQPDQPSRIRVEGGRFDGVCVEARDEDTVEELLERLREAMKGR
jgi:hypothetical protein